MWDTLKNFHDNFHERIEELQQLGGLRIWIIHVLDDGPKNGVEIMDSIQQHYEDMSKRHRTGKHKNHFHRKFESVARRPSPGSVYPMLKKMVDENLITKEDDGRYKLTQKGEEIGQKVLGHLIANHKNMDSSSYAVEHALQEIEGYISYLEDIKTEKLIQHETLVKNLCERLNTIKDSFNEEKVDE